MAHGEYRALLLEHVGLDAVSLAAELHRTQLGDALLRVLDMLGGPVLEPEPILRDCWASMRCRVSGSRRCRCERCRWEERNLKRAEEWRRADALRPQPRHPHAFGSLGDAVSRTVAYHAGTSYALESYLGPALERLAQRAESGVDVREGGGDAESRSAYLAGCAVDVERVLIGVYQDEQRRRGVRTAACIRFLVASFAEEWDVQGVAEQSGVSASIVRGVVKSGRRAATIELAARGLVPEPTRPATIVREIRERRAELGGREAA